MAHSNRQTANGTLTHSLLATTCLAAFGGAAAHAQTTVTEGQNGVDFSSGAPNIYILPTGTTTVFGSIDVQGGNSTDWFEFENLAAGTSFTLTGEFNPLHQEGGLRLQVLNSSSGNIGSMSLEGSGGSVRSVVPNDGKLVVEVYPDSYPEAQGTYEVDLSAQAVPELPVTAIAMSAVALGGALAWRRKRPASA